MLFRKKLFIGSNLFFGKSKADFSLMGNNSNDKKKSKEKVAQVYQALKTHTKDSKEFGMTKELKQKQGEDKKENLTSEISALSKAKIQCGEWNNIGLSTTLLKSSQMSPRVSRRQRGSSGHHQVIGIPKNPTATADNMNHPAFKSSLYCGVNYLSRANQYKRFGKYMNRKNRRAGPFLQSIEEVDVEEDILP